MSKKSQQALFLIEQHLGDVDEVGAIAIIDRLLSEWDIDLTDWTASPEQHNEDD